MNTTKWALQACEEMGSRIQDIVYALDSCVGPSRGARGPKNSEKQDELEVSIIKTKWSVPGISASSLLSSSCLISICSSGEGSIGGGAGQPFGNRARLDIRTILAREEGERIFV